MTLKIFYPDRSTTIFHHLSNFEEKSAGISFRDLDNDYWFITYNAFLSFLLMEEDKNDT